MKLLLKSLIIICFLLTSCSPVAVYNKGERPISKENNNKTSPEKKNIKLKGRSGKKGKSDYFIASWYGNDKHGKTTSGGQIFNMYDLGAIHKSLQPGVTLKIINENNGKEVDVMIIDKENSLPPNEIKISYKTAIQLDILDKSNQKLKIIYLN